MCRAARTKEGRCHSVKAALRRSPVQSAVVARTHNTSTVDYALSSSLPVTGLDTPSLASLLRGRTFRRDTSSSKRQRQCGSLRRLAR